MINIEKSFTYGYYLGFICFIIGLFLGYDHISKKYFYYTHVKNYKYYTDILSIGLVSSFVGFVVGFLIPFIFNFLFLILIALLIIFIGLYCLRLFGFIIMVDYNFQTNQLVPIIIYNQNNSNVQNQQNQQNQQIVSNYLAHTNSNYLNLSNSKSSIPTESNKSKSYFNFRLFKK
jgi:uncharacterized protein YacL